MRIEKVKILKTFCSHSKRVDYVLAQNDTCLKLYKGYLRAPLTLAQEKIVIQEVAAKRIIRNYFDEQGKCIVSSFISILKKI